MASASDNVRALRRPAGRPVSAGRRLRANWPAELRLESGERLPCIVIDLSSAGARVQVAGKMGESRQARLVIDNFPPVAAAVAWRKGSQVGLRFGAEQGWVLELSARRFDSAAWLERGLSDK